MLEIRQVQDSDLLVIRQVQAPHLIEDTDLLPIRQVNIASDETKEQKIAKALLDPALFSTYFLQADLWSIQEQILHAIATKPRVAVKACHASSKTWTAARALLWFLARYSPEAVCVTTAPTWTQVEKLLWGEVHSALSKSRYPFPKATLTELKLGPKRYAYGLSTSVTNQDEGVKFQGIHAEYVLVIMDEAPGVDPRIWTAIEGARAGGNVAVLALGNPTIASGPFYEAFAEQRSGWETFTIDAFDTPNLEGISLKQLIEMPDDSPELDYNPRPYLTTRRWVREKYFEWGPGHPSWEARVRGNFPKQGEDALLSLTWIEQAALRTLDVTTEKVVAGLDVAGPGEDETVLTIRRGNRIIFQRAWPQQDPRGEVVAELNNYKNELAAVNVDSIGIGWGIYLHIKDQGFPAVPINVQEASSDSEKFVNQKAEFYWGLRLRFQESAICGTMDEKTIGQLAGIRYKHNPRGQIYIESKEDAAKRGVKSPDRAESVMLAFANRLLVFGVCDYMKQEQQAIAAAKLMKPAMSDKQLSCPKCEATCVVRITNGMRCNQCGKQFELETDKKPLQKVFTRKDALNK